MTIYRLFSSTDGPSSPVAYSGNFLSGVQFQVTTGGCWLNGFWWWVCESGQSTASQQFALWNLADPGNQFLISAATAVSGTLTAGAWNYVACTQQVPLTIGATYIAATGFTNSFPLTNGQFGPGGAYSSGIVNGPLTAYSDQNGSLPGPIPQGLFGTNGTDPTQSCPAEGSGSANFWMDVQIDTTPPAGSSYRLWPNFPGVLEGYPLSNDTGQQTMGTEFLLSEECALDNIWFYSPPGVSVLPSRCAIWDVATQSVVAGTDNTSPAWTGGPGDGWISCAYSGVILPAGDSKTSVYYGGGEVFYTEHRLYFGGGGPASASGIVNGPLSSPNVASATPPGNSSYQNGPFSYPDTFDDDDNGETRWIDVEVTPTSSTATPTPTPTPTQTVTPTPTPTPTAPPTVNSGAFLIFFDN
jgi:hypothetical protein